MLSYLDNARVMEKPGAQLAHEARGQEFIIQKLEDIVAEEWKKYTYVTIFKNTRLSIRPEVFALHVRMRLLREGGWFLPWFRSNAREVLVMVGERQFFIHIPSRREFSVEEEYLDDE